VGCLRGKVLSGKYEELIHGRVGRGKSRKNVRSMQEEVPPYRVSKITINNTTTAAADTTTATAATTATATTTTTTTDTTTAAVTTTTTTTVVVVVVVVLVK
jgi:hypothetical protein